MLIGIPAAALTTNTLLPPVPTVRDICSSCGRASGEHIHTARDSDEGSICANMLTTSVYLMLLPVVRATAIAAGLPAPRKPRGSPVPEPVWNFASSSNARACGHSVSMSAENETIESWRSSFGTADRPVSFFASRVTRPNFGELSWRSAPSSPQ